MDNTSNLHGFELHRPSSKGTKLLLQVIKAIINQPWSGTTKHQRMHSSSLETIQVICDLISLSRRKGRADKPAKNKHPRKQEARTLNSSKTQEGE